MRKVLPTLILIVVISAGLGVGYYFANFANASGTLKGTNSGIVTWSPFPLKIVISANPSGQASFTCSQPISPVFLTVTNNHPNLVTGSIDISSFASCGSTPNTITVTLTCAPGISAGRCGAVNNPAVLINVCGPTSYQCLGVVNSLEVNSAKA